MGLTDYAIVGRHYSRLRKPDPHIIQLIQRELNDAASIINIGAGTGSYEPMGKRVVAVEPSDTMVGQRQISETVVVRGRAEQLPFGDNSFDAAFAALTIHHWSDWRAGLEEAYRVAKKKIVIFTWICMPNGFWLYDYFPEIEHIDIGLFPTIQQISDVLGLASVTAG